MAMPYMNSLDIKLNIVRIVTELLRTDTITVYQAIDILKAMGKIYDKG